MSRVEHPISRGFLAIVFGVPITATIGWMSLWMTAVSALHVVARLLEGIFGAEGLGFIVDPFLTLAWGAAGLSGIAGFWMWIFASRPISNRKAILISGLLCLGAAAASPLLRSPGDLLQLIAAIACGVAISVIAMCLPTCRSSGPVVAASPLPPLN